MIAPEEFYDAMLYIRDSDNPAFYDEEPRHRAADALMCEVLAQHGYGDGVKIFEDMPKWYA